jgi:hypothetical protein
MNNPLAYVDPDGEWWFIIPQISFGKNGFSLGLELGVGVPGILSASVTGGYNLKNNEGYWSAQGTRLLNALHRLRVLSHSKKWW